MEFTEETLPSSSHHLKGLTWQGNMMKLNTTKVFGLVFFFLPLKDSSWIMHIFAVRKETYRSYYTNSHINSNIAPKLPIKKKKRLLKNNCWGSSVFIYFLKICRWENTKADGWRAKTVRHDCCQILLTPVHEVKHRLSANNQANWRHSGISASISDCSLSSGSFNSCARAIPTTLKVTRFFLINS